jgi:hypothetical protein
LFLQKAQGIMPCAFSFCFESGGNVASPEGINLTAVFRLFLLQFGEHALRVCRERLIKTSCQGPLEGIPAPGCVVKVGIDSFRGSKDFSRREEWLLALSSSLSGKLSTIGIDCESIHKLF